MDDNVLVALIGSVTSVVCTFGTVVLTRFLERRDPRQREPDREAPAHGTPGTDTPPAGPPAATGRRLRPVAHPSTVVAVVLAAIVLASLAGIAGRIADGSSDKLLWILAPLFVLFAVGIAAVLILHAYRAGRRHSMSAIAFVLLEGLAVMGAISFTNAVYYEMIPIQFLWVLVAIAGVQIAAATVGLLMARS